MYTRRSPDTDIYKHFVQAHKTHREELDLSLWLLGKILCLLPELLARRWQCHSMSKIMGNLLHFGNSTRLRREGVRYFLLWYQALEENAPSYVHVMFTDLIPGVIVPNKGAIRPDGEFDTSDVFNHPNMKVEVGTSVFHDMFSHPVQVSESVAILPPSSNEKSTPPDPKEGLEVVLNSMVQVTGSLKWRDNCIQKDRNSFAFLLDRFKEIFLPVFCPNFDVISSIYEPKAELPIMRTVNKKEVISSCIVVLINWISRFVHEKHWNNKQNNTYLQTEDHATLDPKLFAYYQGRIVRDVLYSSQKNINFIHAVYRQAFLFCFTTKAQVEALRTTIAVYREWMTNKDPPAFLLDPDEGDIFCSNTSSIDALSRHQKLKTSSFAGAVRRDVTEVQSGLQNVLQVFIVNASNVFLVNTSHSNIVFPPFNRDYRSTPLNEQTDVCKKVLNVYRTMVMNTRMDQKTWELLLLVLLQVTSIVLNQNTNGSKPSLGTRLGQAIFQTLIVTWIRAHTNVPINVQLWERFLNVLTALTCRYELIHEWDKTMQTLTRVLGRYVYNLNIHDLPLDRLADSKGKRRRIASVWQGSFKKRSTDDSLNIIADKNTDNFESEEKKENLNDRSHLKMVSESLVAPFAPVLSRCYSDGSISSPGISRVRLADKCQRTLDKPSSFESSLSAIVGQNTAYIHVSSENLCLQIFDCHNPPRDETLRRAVSLNSFHVKNTNNQTRDRESDSLHDSRSSSPTASSGIEGGSVKDSPLQIDVLVTDAASCEDTVSMTSSGRRSIILGGSVGGWLPEIAAIMWKRMLGSLGDINLISKPELHAQVFKQLLEMTGNLIKIKKNQGISEDNQSTPYLPSFVPEIGIAGPWCYGSQLLGKEYKKGQLAAVQLLCMLAVHDSVSGIDHLSLFYNLIHNVFTDEDRLMIYCLFKHLEGARFLSLLLPGHTILLLDIVHASAVLLTSRDTNRSAPRSEVLALLGSLLCYPWTLVPKLVLQPSMQQIELMECSDLQDHILNIMLRCGRREPSSKARCVAFAQLGQWIYLELMRPVNKNTFSQTVSQNIPRRENAVIFHPRINDAMKVLLQGLQFKHRAIIVEAICSLKTICGLGYKLLLIEKLPQLIITALCKALELRHVPTPKESDKIIITSLIMCLGEFCMAFPLQLMLDPIEEDQQVLIINVLRVLFQLLSGKRQSNSFFLCSDTDFDLNITADDVPNGKLNSEASFQSPDNIQRYELSIRLCARAMIMHLATFLGHFPPGIGASRLSSLVREQDDLYTKVVLSENQESRRDSADLSVPEVLQSQRIQLFMLNSSLMASFIELPTLKLPGGGVTAGLIIAKMQVRVLLRDLNGKSCWESSIMYSIPKKIREHQCGSYAVSELNKIKHSNQQATLFYTLYPNKHEVSTIHRHTMRHRSPNSLPIASESALDMDQLNDLLQYVAHTSPEILTNTKPNMPGISPVGCQREAQAISILLNQRSSEQEYVTNFLKPAKEQHFLSRLHQTYKQSSEYSSPTSLYKPDCAFQYCRLLFSHLGLAGWERRSRTHLLQRNEKLMRELRNVDMQKCRDTHKIAVVYVASGQEDKNSILKNTQGSSAYEMFVSALGWEIDLEAHSGFLGGLPRQGCGATAPYYASSFVEVIYHVATRMPSDTPDSLLTKIRHLGNDEVHIVWSEHQREYRRDILPTEFCDVLIVVYPLKNCLFRVTVSWKSDVPWFGPLANESVVNGSCLASLVRETAINASRSKRSSLSLYQQYYEERYRSLESVTMRYKENSTFEDFANRLYSPITPALHITLRESTINRSSEPFAAALIDHHRATVKDNVHNSGWLRHSGQTTPEGEYVEIL